MKKLVFLISGVVMAGILSAGANLAGGKNTRSVQIVYHSDTRGYYEPCG